jgi:hypothetical protein
MMRAAVAAAALLLAGCSSPGAAASCAGPFVTVTPDTFAPGEEVRVAGEFFRDDCYDTGQTGTPPASKDVEIRLVTPEDTFVLTTADPDDEGDLDTAVRIPDDVPVGSARIEAGVGARVSVEVTEP